MTFTGVGECPPGINIPIFYHCEPDSVERENGALEGAAGAFLENDEVIVQCEVTGASQYSPLYVIGFTDKPKPCGITFYFKLTRNDGTLITEISGLLSYIKLYNSDDSELGITTPVYNAASEEWSFGLIDPGNIDEDGYWVDYKCGCGFATQYPDKVLSADKRQAGDLIQPGKYEDTIRLSCFQFKVVRDDGAIVTPAMSYFKIRYRNTLGVSTYVDKTYDADPGSPTYQHWLFEILSPHFDPAGFWISFSQMPLAINCQYPWRYKVADAQKPEDLIQPGQYTGAVPYWETIASDDGPTYVTEVGYRTCEEKHAFGPHIYHDHAATSINFYTVNKTAERTIAVMSSVPYKLVAQGDYEGSIYGWGYTSEGGFDVICPDELPGPTCYAWAPTQIEISGSGVNISCDPSLGETMDETVETFHGANIGGANHSIELVITVGDSEDLQVCYEWVPPDNIRHEKLLEFPWEKVASIENIYSRIQIGATYEY